MGGMSTGQGITNIASSVANVGAGWFASHQLNKGSNAQRDAQKQANTLYGDLYNETKAGYAPYQEGGLSAFDNLLKTYGIGTTDGRADLTGFDTTDLEFQRNQGVQARDRSAASRGRLFSGAQQKAVEEYGQGVGSNYLDQYRKGLFNISNQGLSATNALTNYRQGYGEQYGQGLVNIGDIEMARRLGRANINYRNVAAQDSIWGAGGGGSSSQPQANWGGTSSSSYNGGSTTPGFNSDSSYNYPSTATNFNWGG